VTVDEKIGDFAGTQRGEINPEISVGIKDDIRYDRVTTPDRDRLISSSIS
jgi:hypothetical protein